MTEWLPSVEPCFFLFLSFPGASGTDGFFRPVFTGLYPFCLILCRKKPGEGMRQGGFPVPRQRFHGSRMLPESATHG
ncbi:hypothetical protein HMPREF3038_00633 [Akkermansia sp. KLE1797]|nr:hypothetical protein HMPREF3038_00633 [Akkermansia sp. KLE1797]KXU54283.1 hypothetical protein HMPREF3039_01612 [Akkermansia sp. KLE1798]